MNMSDSNGIETDLSASRHFRHLKKRERSRTGRVFLPCSIFIVVLQCNTMGGENMAHVSLRVTDQEKGLMESYAKLHGVNLSDAIKSAFFEKLEDEYDLRWIEKYEADETTYTHEEVGRMLGLK